jgi:hypothetical protein
MTASDPEYGERAHKALDRGFIVEDKPGGTFVITCRTCKEHWSLKPGGVGNVLHLLNHEASHR